MLCNNNETEGRSGSASIEGENGGARSDQHYLRERREQRGMGSVQVQAEVFRDKKERDRELCGVESRTEILREKRRGEHPRVLTQDRGVRLGLQAKEEGKLEGFFSEQRLGLALALGRVGIRPDFLSFFFPIFFLLSFAAFFVFSQSFFLFFFTFKIQN